MKVLQINIFGNLSTGRITVDLYRTLKKEGHEGIIAFARNDITSDVPHIRIGSGFDVKFHGLMTRITDRAGFYSAKATKRLIKDIQIYNPDIIHLHNIHGYYLNIEILFNFLKNYGKPIVWTLHDCWSYTGHCCYYSMQNCSKWKDGCQNCPQKKAYPASLLIDNSYWNYQKKKKLFMAVPNMTLVAVSNWLAGEVIDSFMKDYPLQVIHNGIDTEVFKPTQSNFRKQYGIENKMIILGVASTWDVRKGLKDFIELSQMLSDEYVIVIVGVNEKENDLLPTNMIGLSRTDSIEELAGIYTAADVFFNASVEETFGLPTVEAMACGTPVIVYDATALPEVVNKECGYVVDEHNLEDVKRIVVQLHNENIFESHRIIQIASEFDKKDKYIKYIEIYKKSLD